MFLEPFVGIVKEVLLAPQHPGQRLPHHTRLIFADAGRGYRLIERVGLVPALLDDLIELAAEGIPGGSVAQPQPDDGGFAGAHVELIVRGGLGPRLVRVDGLLPARHDIIVDPILDIRRRVGCAEQPLVVRVVFGEQQLRISVAMQQEAAELGMRRFDRDCVLPPASVARRVSAGPATMSRYCGTTGSAVRAASAASGPRLAQADLDQDVGRRRFRVFDEHIEISVIVENAGIE